MKIVGVFYKFGSEPWAGSSADAAPGDPLGAGAPWESVLKRPWRS